MDPGIDPAVPFEGFFGDGIHLFEIGSISNNIKRVAAAVFDLIDQRC